MAMACFDDFVMMPGLLGWIPLVGIWEQWRIKFKSDVTQGIPLFANIGMSGIKKVVCMGRLMTVPEKWPLMQEGSLGDEMFVILDGSVSVQKHGKTVTMLGRGETVGEMGLISEHPRSADVLVNEETTVFAFGYEALERLERRYPRLATKVLHNLAAILSGRLAATTEQLL
jgi:CRP-like cAMP-binding protein